MGVLSPVFAGLQEDFIPGELRAHYNPETDFPKTL